MRPFRLVPVGILALICTTPPASAQSIVAGLSAATITFKPDDGSQGLPGGDRRTGLAAGLSLEVRPSDRGFWQVEVLFHQKGVRNLLRIDDEIRVDYLEIPWLMHMDVWQGNRQRAIFFTAGPVLAFRLRASYEDDGVREDITDDTSAFDFGLAVGGGVEFGRVRIETRYTWGQRRVFEDGELEGKFRNRSVILLAGFRLR